MKNATRDFAVFIYDIKLQTRYNYCLHSVVFTPLLAATKLAQLPKLMTRL